MIESSRKITVLISLCIVGSILLLGKLYILQIINRDIYKTFSENNRIRTRLIPPKRGKIRDIHGTVIATNKLTYNLYITPEDCPSVKETLEFLRKIAPSSAIDNFSLSHHIHPSYPQLISTDISWKNIAAIEMFGPEMPGVSIAEEEKRYYPLGKNLAHISGYVGPVSHKDRSAYSYIPNVAIGKEGIEKSYEYILQGIPGQEVYEVNAHGRIIRSISQKPPLSGQDITLTIDAKLQKYCMELITQYPSAAITVLEINSGAIRAMASSPSFDPNTFVGGIPHTTWKNLLNNPYAPLSNKNIMGRYSPGSIFKIIVALAALEAGISPHNTVHCHGHIAVGNHKFHCWKRGGHGRINMEDAIAQSCDIYFYDLAKKIGIRPIISLASRFGYGKMTDIDLPNEVKAFLASPKWKRKHKKEPWYLGDTINASIGQGYILATPIQMATALARIVNGGMRITPHICQNVPQTRKRYLTLSKHHQHIIHKGLLKATKKGTAYRVGGVKGMHIAGKTSTTQVRRITPAERKNGILKSHQLPWNLRDHSMFIGYAPAEKPQYVITVLGEHEGWGGVFAAKIAAKVFQKIHSLTQEKI